MPDLALTTDLIVGFPGETEDDFEQTVALVERVRYDTFYAFKYSPRSGTAAARREDDVTPEEKQRRLALLLELQRRLSHEVNQAWVGRTVEVLIEGTRREARQRARRAPARTRSSSCRWHDGLAPGRFADAAHRARRGPDALRRARRRRHEPS